MEFLAAELADYTALFPLAGAKQWKGARVQILGAPAWTLWRGDRRQLICGLWPLHGGILEAWLMVPDENRPGLPALRFLLDRTREVMPERTIVTRIADDNMAGQRMALLAGFWPVEEHLPGTSIRTWSRPGCP